jgi:hypothetical protein
MLVRLWRELHPSDPVQLQLTFGNSETKETSKIVRKRASLMVLPFVALPHACVPELIRAVTDTEDPSVSG